MQKRGFSVAKVNHLSFILHQCITFVKMVVLECVDRCITDELYLWCISDELLGGITMATNMNRIMISVPTDIEAEIERLKKTTYYDRPYSEIYWDLIRLGMEKMNEETKGSEKE